MTIADYVSNATTKQKNEWNAKTYKRYTLLLRHEEDKEYIDFIENAKEKKIPLAEIVKEGIDKLKFEGI